VFYGGTTVVVDTTTLNFHTAVFLSSTKQWN